MKSINRRPICNNKPNTAPIINGKTFFLCWRCLGSVIGIAVSLLVQKTLFAPLSLHRHFVCITILSIPALIDYVMNTLEIKKESNILRFFTGLLLGGVVAHCEIISLHILRVILM